MIKVLQRLKRIIRRKNLLLLNDPCPLVNKEYKLGIMWTPKAGCTYAVKWFFFQTNILDKALEYDSWVHNYRMDIIQNNLDYKKTLYNLNVKRITFIKFVRNPYTRTVSSFFHVLMIFNNDDPRMKQIKNQIVNIFFVDNMDGSLSFKKFLEILKSTDLKTIDRHLAPQFSEVERSNLIKPIILQIEKADVELPKLEQDLNLKSSNNSDRLKKSYHHRDKFKTTEFVGEKRFFDNNTIPDYNNFYNKELQDLVYSIYQDDFKNYNYSYELK